MLAVGLAVGFGIQGVWSMNVVKDLHGLFSACVGILATETLNL